MHRIFNRPVLPVAAAVICTVAMVHHLQADSLWQRHNPRRAFLFEDSRARRPGDLLTIIITQSTAVNNKEQRALDKSSESGAKFDLATSTGGDLGTSSATGSFDASSETGRKFAGQATYSDNRVFQDRMTVRVIALDEAGNMVIEGHRNVQISGENRVLTIRGVVRQVDLGPDNTVNSQYVSDMEVLYEGEGTEKRFTRQGWLGRAMNKIWPF